MDLVSEVYHLIAQFPHEEKYGLRSQISRSAISIPSNIAEGSARNSETEFVRFLEIAMGSAFELETQLILAKRLKLSEANETDELLEKLNRIQKQLHNLILSIKRPYNK